MSKEEKEPMILEGDCIELMKEFDENTFDAIVTDPPYGLEFMNKSWDKLQSEGIWQSKTSPGVKDKAFRERVVKHCPTYQAGLEMQLWHTQWLTEAFRVLKPGGSMLVMGGTRTFHRLMVAIEDTGFIIKDTLMWLYGSGFPKAQDLGKMIDKRNGRKVEDYKQLGEYLKRQRGDRPQKEISKFFPSKTGGLTGCVANWELGLNVPTKFQWQILKKELSLDDKFDWLIEREEAEREKIGEQRGVHSKIGSGTGGHAVGIPQMQINIPTTTPSTDLAKHWDGFKVGGVKPAYEPIVWAVKPPEGSYIDNVLKWGVGAVNVDECRVGVDDNDGNKRKATGSMGGSDSCFGVGNKHRPETLSKGRFPANVILSHHLECEQVGVKRVKGISGGEGETHRATFGKEQKGKPFNYADPNGCETVESWDCHPDCAIRMLDEQSGDRSSTRSSGNPNNPKHGMKHRPTSYGLADGEDTQDYRDNGGASRFFYCAKASRGERNRGLEGMEDVEVKGQPSWLSEKGVHNETGKPNKPIITKNNHPTVKPLKLFEYLIKLVTRKGQIILDPFLGSGTTMIAANNVDRECVGIEREEEYIEIAEKRVEYWLKEKEK